MKKFFLIPLLTLLTCVMAWAADAHVSNITDLKAAIADASVETIYLDKDIQYQSTAESSCINILRSVTIDGQGHTLRGYGRRASSGNYPTIAINQKVGTTATTMVDVVLKNINIVSTYTANYSCRPIETRGNIRSLTLINDSIYGVNSGNKQIITIGGSQNSNAAVTIKDCVIGKGNSGYGMILFNPITLDIKDSEINAWCSFYFKGKWDPINNFSNSCHGAVNTKIEAENCIFNNPGQCGASNSFGAFVLEDDGIDMKLTNCVVKTPYNCTNATQVVYLLSKWKKYIDNNLTDKTSGKQCKLVIEGANSHIQGDFINYSWDVEDLDTIPVNFELMGGSYYGADFEAAVLNPHVSIATGYHAENVKQGTQDLYRITMDAAVNPSTSTLYDLNDNVEKQGNGDNPATSFELSTGDKMTLNQETTEAGYVQVKDNATEGATTITVAKNETNTDQSQKLVINNGLDVQGKSQVIVEPTAALIIGKGGIVTSKPENIILKADEDGAATLLLDPAITVNQNPNLTVTLKAQSKQLTASPWTYVFHRFAIPVKVGVKPTTDDAGKALFPGETSFESYVFQWNGYSWVTNPSWTALKPFVGYQLANNSADGGITYTFTGELVGNDNSTYEFPTGGFDFFGNSHLAPIYIDSLLKPYMGSNVEASVWLYNYGRKNFEPITPDDLAEGFAFATEIKPMEGFILNLHAASGSATMDYASAIWGNPKFDAVLGRPSQKGAPARKSAGVATSNRALVAVTAMNGMSDNVKLIEKETYSADFENGADASKFKFEEAINLYAETEAGELSRVATNDMKGTLLSFQSGDDTSYTLSLSNVLGEDYMLRDNVTGALVAFEEGATYNFTQDANTTIPARFEVVSAAKITTAIDSVEAEANASGIYSITGQFLGRDFTKLPAGVYVVNGVKIVK